MLIWWTCETITISVMGSHVAITQLRKNLTHKPKSKRTCRGRCVGEDVHSGNCSRNELSSSLIQFSMFRSKIPLRLKTTSFASFKSYAYTRHEHNGC